MKSKKAVIRTLALREVIRQRPISCFDDVLSIICRDRTAQFGLATEIEYDSSNDSELLQSFRHHFPNHTFDLKIVGSVHREKSPTATHLSNVLLKLREEEEQLKPKSLVAITCYFLDCNVGILAINQKPKQLRLANITGVL